MNTGAPPTSANCGAMVDPESPRSAVVRILADTLVAMHLQKSAPGNRSAGQARQARARRTGAVMPRNHLIVVSESAPVSTKGGPERPHTRPGRCES